MLVAIDPSARRDWLIGFACSAALHLVLLGGGWTLFRPAQYGVETGSGGLEVSLVAAPPRAVSSGEGVLGEPAQLSPAPVSPPVLSGDGSSVVPGMDPTSFYSQGGGQSDAAPGPFRNPAPPYPWAARLLGQEGGVVLRIAISQTGRPTRVEVQRSSGYPLLDESAATTVRRWKFLPARTAGIPHDSLAMLRVRFRLEENIDTMNREKRRIE